jgi:hypothetical protein
MRIVLLALMLAVSHIGLVSHVSAHFEPELEHCELCVSQAKLLSAIPSPDQVLEVGEPFMSVVFAGRQNHLPQNHKFVCHPRAPPSRSA